MSFVCSVKATTEVPTVSSHQAHIGLIYFLTAAVNCAGFTHWRRKKKKKLNAIPSDTQAQKNPWILERDLSLEGHANTKKTPIFWSLPEFAMLHSHISSASNVSPLSEVDLINYSN